MHRDNATELSFSPIESQKVTSKNTSINSSRLPKGIGYLLASYDIEGKTVLDYGCGKFSNSDDAISSAGGSYIPFDPYNQPYEVNERATLLSCNGVDYIVCSNVLNVIKEDSALNETVNRLNLLLKKRKECMLILTIYEGNKSKVGNITRADQYQRNELNISYRKIFEQRGLVVNMKKGCLLISNPNIK